MVEIIHNCLTLYEKYNFKCFSVTLIIQTWFQIYLNKIPRRKFQKSKIFSGNVHNSVQIRLMNYREKAKYEVLVINSREFSNKTYIIGKP